MLGAALIVRDEERCLARCLSSLAGIVDEIVIVDTGSVDATVDIARSFGATVLHREWDNDFSTPRNLGLEHVISQWVLYIDADEYLAPTNRSVVEGLLSDPEVLAYRIRHRFGVGYTPYFEYRLWRNRPDIRFEGVIHETVVRSLYRIAQREQLQIGDVELLLEHDGYEGEQEAKHRRNLPLLLEQVERDPTRPYLWDHIGRIQCDLGEVDEARASWLHGIDLVRANGQRELADSLVFFRLIVSNCSLGQPDQALADEARQRFPGDAVVVWAAALDAVARDDHVATIALVDQLLAIDPEHTARLGLTIETRILTELAPHLRGMAAFKLGQFEAAAADFELALSHRPEQAEYRVKRDLALAKARR